jgi:hypothetical protein
MVRNRWSRLVVAGVVLAAGIAVAVTGYRMWFGDPYPKADPDAVAWRLEQRSQLAYETLALPRSALENDNTLETGYCPSTGLRSLTDWDSSQPGVVDVRHSWDVRRISEATARDSLRRLRDMLASSGWTQLQNWNGSGAGYTDLGFQYEDHASGDRLNAQWHSGTNGLFISLYAPCTRVAPEAHPPADSVNYPDHNTLLDDPEPGSTGSVDRGEDRDSRPGYDSRTWIAKLPFPPREYDEP